MPPLNEDEQFRAFLAESDVIADAIETGSLGDALQKFNALRTILPHLQDPVVQVRLRLRVLRLCLQLRSRFLCEESERSERDDPPAGLSYAVARRDIKRVLRSLDGVLHGRRDGEAPDAPTKTNRKLRRQPHDTDRPRSIGV